MLKTLLASYFNQYSIFFNLLSQTSYKSTKEQDSLRELVLKLDVCRLSLLFLVSRQACHAFVTAVTGVTVPQWRVSVTSCDDSHEWLNHNPSPLKYKWRIWRKKVPRTWVTRFEVSASGWCHRLQALGALECAVFSSTDIVRFVCVSECTSVFKIWFYRRSKNYSVNIMDGKQLGNSELTDFTRFCESPKVDRCAERSHHQIAHFSVSGVRIGSYQHVLLIESTK